MTSYIEITESETDPGAPVTSELGKKWRDNPIALALQSDNCPLVLGHSYPYNMTVVGDGSTGIIWDASVDGTVATIETPALDTSGDWSYIIQFENVRPSPGTSVTYYREIYYSGAWQNKITVGTTPNSSYYFNTSTSVALSQQYYSTTAWDYNPPLAEKARLSTNYGSFIEGRVRLLKFRVRRFY